MFVKVLIDTYRGLLGCDTS